MKLAVSSCVNICPPISSFSHSFTCASVQESIIFQTEVSTPFLPLRKRKLCRNKGKLSSGPGWSQSAASAHLPWEVPGQGTGEEQGGQEGRTWRVGDFPALERIAQVSLDIQPLKPDTLYQCEHHSCKPCVQTCLNENSCVAIDVIFP